MRRCRLLCACRVVVSPVQDTGNTWSLYHSMHAMGARLQRFQRFSWFYRWHIHIQGRRYSSFAGESSRQASLGCGGLLPGPLSLVALARSPSRPHPPRPVFAPSPGRGGGRAHKGRGEGYMPLFSGIVSRNLARVWDASGTYSATPAGLLAYPTRTKNLLGKASALHPG
jgi:hypothetical protein